MFILGILSVFQITFIPGFIFLTLFYPEKRSAIQISTYCYALSILFNYLLSCLLTMLGIYTSTAVQLVVALELLYLAIYFFRRPRIAYKGAAPSFLSPVVATNLLGKLSAIVGLLGIGILCAYALQKVGTVFQFSDEIGSYNSWALQWTLNKFPDANDTFGYPVGIPANWSLGYLFMGNSSIQFFNKISMVFFPISCSLLFWELGVRSKKYTLLSAIPIFTATLILFTPQFIGAGTLDIPASCVAFLCFYVALDLLKNGFDFKKIILMHLFAASSASLKQSGLFVVAGVLALTVYFIFRQRRILTQKQIMRTISWSIAISFFLSLSWYLWIQYQIYEGRASSEATYLTKGIHQGRNYSERLLWALRMFFCLDRGLKSQILISLISALTIFTFFLKKTRILFLAVISYFFLWALFFSYEVRTLALIFPFMAYLCAESIDYFLSILKIKTDFPIASSPLSGIVINPNLKKYIFLCSVLVIFALNFTALSENKLIARQNYLQKEIMDADLNHKLYSYNNQFGISGKIASTYGILKFLPEINNFYFKLRAPTSLDLLSYLEEREDIHYLLISIDRNSTAHGFSLTEAPAIQEIENKLAAGKFKLLFRHNDLGFIKIK